ncbi:MAG TPA: efflux RND transporter periplasmic adaptor subunit, partial [Gemmatimonadaceae bacterium]
MTGLTLKHLGCFIIVLVAACRRSKDSAPPRPPVVEVVRVEQRDVPVYSEWVATFDGYTNAQIQPQVTGYLIAQRFREGSFVKKDQILFEIDPRPFRATLDQATAQLGEAIADEVRTLEDVKRDRPLAEARAIPRQQLDTDIQLHNAAVSAVRAARAAVRTAEINLGFTHVRSLIDGIVGVAEEQVGNLVTTASVLTSVSQIEPIKAWFAITEQEYLNVADRLHAATTPAGKSGRPGLDFRITLADGSEYPHAGTFLFANRQVDSLTGTLRIATSFPNPKRLLRPGQFGRVRTATRVEHNAILVPQRSVSELQGTFQVMVVNADSSVTVQPVRIGPQVDSLWVIER